MIETKKGAVAAVQFATVLEMLNRFELV